MDAGRGRFIVDLGFGFDSSVRWRVQLTINSELRGVVVLELSPLAFFSWRVAFGFDVF
jgi:hypothetical protein